MRPLIGLPLAVRERRDQPPDFYIRHTYVDAIIGAGGTPFLIGPSESDALLRDVFERLDGLMLSGGADVNPFMYGEQPHPTTEAEDVRDQLESTLTRWAIEDSLPTLGICRGMQLLNVVMGGTLIQDLPSAGYSHPHSVLRSDLVHELDVDPTSRLAEVLGQTVFSANSFHHQAVGRLGEDLKITARAGDGVIEGMEGTKHPWLLAVQFHPEDLTAFHEPSRHLFQRFVAAASHR